MTTPIDAAKSSALQVIGNALRDQKSANMVQTNPAIAFRLADLDIPEDRETEFNEYVREVAPELLTVLNDPGQRTPELNAAAVQAGWGCTACKVGAWSIATALVAIGAAGLATLSTSSSIVLAVASFIGTTATRALALIQGLTSVVSAGVSKVASEICEWVGACS